MGNKKWVPLVFDRDIDAYNEVMAHFTQTILAAHRQWKGNENVAVCQSVPDEGGVPMEAIRKMMQWYEQGANESELKEVDSVRSWLATQTKGGE